MTMRRFEVVCRELVSSIVSPELVPGGELIVKEVSAESKEEAGRIFEGLGYRVGSVKELGVVIDWERQSHFNRAEAGEFLRCTAATVSELMAKGVLPSSRFGDPIFSRRVLEELVSKRMSVVDWGSVEKLFRKAA